MYDTIRPHILSVIGAVLVLFGCPRLAFSDECIDTTCVGIVVPLSSYGEFGTAMINGINLANEVDAARPSRISFRFEDSGFDNTRAVTSLRKLAKIDGVKIAYVLGSPLSAAVAPLADRLNVVTLVSSNEPSLPARHKNVIRFSNPINDLAVALYNELKARNLFRVGLVVTENPFMNAMIEALRSGADSSFHFQELHRAGSDVMDFRSVVTRIKRSQFDVIGVLLYPGQVSRFYRQVAEQRLTIQSFGSDVFESESEVRDSGSGIRGAFFVNHQVSETFRQRYMAKFGNDTLIAFAAWGHDLVVVLREALAGFSGPVTIEQILGALQQNREYTGVSGRIRFVKTEAGDRYFSFPLVVKAVK
jgi:ABC-type branched-subunit amino acid transport system substrate-binding protein